MTPTLDMVAALSAPAARIDPMLAWSLRRRGLITPFGRITPFAAACLQRLNGRPA